MASTASASVTGSSPMPMASTSNVSRPSSGSARSPLASPTITNPPRPVCPTSTPMGSAMTSAISTASTL